MPRRALGNVPPLPHALDAHIQAEVSLDTLVHRWIALLWRVAELDALVQPQTQMNPRGSRYEVLELRLLLVDEMEDVALDDFNLTESGTHGLAGARVGDVSERKHVIALGRRDLEGGSDVDEPVRGNRFGREAGEELGSWRLAGAHEHQISGDFGAVLQLDVKRLCANEGRETQRRDDYATT